MKLVTAIVKPFKLDDVKHFLKSEYKVLRLQKLRVLDVKKATQSSIVALNMLSTFYLKSKLKWLLRALH